MCTGVRIKDIDSTYYSRNTDSLREGWDGSDPDQNSGGSFVGRRYYRVESSDVDLSKRGVGRGVDRRSGDRGRSCYYGEGELVFCSSPE